MNARVAGRCFRECRSLFVATQSAQQPYLTRVVNIVKRDPPQLRQQLLPSRCSSRLYYCKPQRAVLALEQLFVCAPCGFSIRTWFRPRKKVTAFKHKGTALTSLNSSPYRVFPIRGVQRDFPNVVAIASRAPCRLFRAHSTQRLLQIWTMPCPFFIGFIEQGKNEIGRVHGGSSRRICALRNDARIALRLRRCQPIRPCRL